VPMMQTRKIGMRLRLLTVINRSSQSHAGFGLNQH
jgi:hypothetical protein